MSLKTSLWAGCIAVWVPTITLADSAANRALVREAPENTLLAGDVEHSLSGKF